MRGRQLAFEVPGEHEGTPGLDSCDGGKVPVQVLAHRHGGVTLTSSSIALNLSFSSMEHGGGPGGGRLWGNGPSHTASGSGNRHTCLDGDSYLRFIYSTGASNSLVGTYPNQVIAGMYTNIVTGCSLQHCLWCQIIGC